MTAPAFIVYIVCDWWK